MQAILDQASSTSFNTHSLDDLERFKEAYFQGSVVVSSQIQSNSQFYWHQLLGLANLRP